MTEASGVLQGGDVFTARATVSYWNREGQVLTGDEGVERRRRGNRGEDGRELHSADGRITGCRHAPWLSFFLMKQLRKEKASCGYHDANPT